MEKSAEKHYLQVFSDDYGIPDKEILEVMRENEEFIDPEDFDFDYWENLVREELRKKA